jgi:hypothetical protein
MKSSITFAIVHGMGAHILMHVDGTCTFISKTMVLIQVNYCLDLVIAWRRPLMDDFIAYFINLGGSISLEVCLWTLRRLLSHNLAP